MPMGDHVGHDVRSHDEGLLRPLSQGRLCELGRCHFLGHIFSSLEAQVDRVGTETRDRICERSLSNRGERVRVISTTYLVIMSLYGALSRLATDSMRHYVYVVIDLSHCRLRGGPYISSSYRAASAHFSRSAPSIALSLRGESVLRLPFQWSTCCLAS